MGTNIKRPVSLSTLYFTGSCSFTEFNNASKIASAFSSGGPLGAGNEVSRRRPRGTRVQVRSLILTSQLPIPRWHEQIGVPTVADGILDRLVHNRNRIEMRGHSL